MAKISITVVVEDDLSLEIVKHIIVNSNSRFSISRVLPDTSRRKASRGNTYIRQKVNAFNNAAKYENYLIMTDLDSRECAPQYRSELLPHGINSNLILQIAVREIEAWLIADKINFAEFLGISKDLIRPEPECIPGPKEYIYSLARRSKRRTIREGILPRDKTARIGPHYNSLLIGFVQNFWDYKHAMKHAASLHRFVKKIQTV